MSVCEGELFCAEELLALSNMVTHGVFRNNWIVGPNKRKFFIFIRKDPHGVEMDLGPFARKAVYETSSAPPPG